MASKRPEGSGSLFGIVRNLFSRRYADEFCDEEQFDYSAEEGSVFDKPAKIRKYSHSVFLPNETDGFHLSYRYRFAFDILDFDALASQLEKGQWRLSAKHDNGVVRLFSGDYLVGHLNNAKRMLADWIESGLPYIIVVQSADEETGGFLHLGFYRNNLEHYKNREQAVVALTSCKSELKQDAIRFLKDNAMVCIDCHESDDQIAVVTDGCDVIGNLPKKAAERFFDDEIVFAVVDHIEERFDANGNDYLAPFVRLYFN